MAAADREVRGALAAATRHTTEQPPSEPMPDDRYEFAVGTECPVCAEALETADAVYEHLRIHDLDLDELLADEPDRDDRP